MTIRTKLEIAGALVAIVLIALALASWREAKNDTAALKATMTTEAKVVVSASAHEAATDKAADKAVAALETTRKSIRTPSQAFKALPEAIPLPVPLLVVPPAQDPHGGTSQLPAPPVAKAGDAIIPAADLQPLADFGIACQECKTKLDASTKDRADDALKLKAVTGERDAALADLKGGTFWKRVKRNGKMIVIGIAIGAAAGAVAAHH